MEISNTINIQDVYLSLLRWILGLSIGSSLGFGMALIGSYKPSSLILRVLNDFLRSIPIIGLVPVIQMNIGINEYGKIGLIAWTVLFPVWITVRNSFERKYESSELILHAANIKGRYYFKVFTFPKIFGGFLKGIEIGIGIAWLAVVAAEWIGTYTQGFWSGGLGYKLTVGYDLNNWNTVHLGLLIFGILGLFTGYLWHGIMLLTFKKSKAFNPILSETEG